MLATVRKLSGTDAPVPNWLANAVEQRKHLFSIETFPLPNNSNLNSINSDAGITLAGGHQTAALGKLDKILVVDLSTRFGIDAIEALVLLKSRQLLRKGPAHWEFSDVEEYEADEDWWEEMQIFYFQERLAIYDMLSLLLRLCTCGFVLRPRETSQSGLTAEDNGKLSPTSEWCDVLSVATLAKSTPRKILNHFCSLSLCEPPQASSLSFRQLTFWSKQYIREQKETLDLLFFFWYLHTPSGADVKALIECIKSVEWAAKQACASYWDNEAHAIGREVSCILVAISVEALSIERFATAEDHAVIPLASQKLPSDDSLLSADLLASIHLSILALNQAFPVPTGPLLLGWSFILSRLTASIGKGELAQEYAAFVANLFPRSDNQQPLWQRLLASSLTNCFTCLLPCLPAPSASSANMLGLLSVYRSLLALLPALVSLAFLDQDCLNLITECAVKLYGHQEAGPLRRQFWGLDGASEDILVESERQILDFFAGRFPLQSVPMLQLLQALSKDTEPPDLPRSHSQCSATASQYFRSLPYLCIRLEGTSPLKKAFETSTQDPSEVQIVQAGKGLRITQNVYVPRYTTGRIMSADQNGRSVLQLNLIETGWNGWLWIDDLLEEYTGRLRLHKVSGLPSTSHIDPFSSSPPQARPGMFKDSDEDQDQVLADALKLLSTSSTSIEGGSVQLIERRAQNLFGVLEKALRKSGSRSRQITAATLDSLRSLLPAYPGLIWSLFQLNASSLFYSQRSIKSSSLSGGSTLLRLDKSAGTFESTNALLDLITSLYLEAQRSLWADTTDHRHAKRDVLCQALRWVNEEIWSAGWQNWRYAKIHQRWETGSKLCELWATVIYDASFLEGGLLEVSGTFLLDSFLSPPTHLPGIATVVPLVHLLAHTCEHVLLANRGGRYSETRSIEQCAQGAMSLARQLIALRKQRSGNLSALEVMLYESSSPQVNLGSMAINSTLANLLTCASDTLNFAETTSAFAAYLVSALLDPPMSELISILPSFRRPEEEMAKILEASMDTALTAKLRISLWTLLDSITLSQPALAMLLITGSLRSTGNGDAVSDTKNRRTLLHVAYELLVVRSTAMPDMLHVSVLRALCTAWQYLVDHPDSFKALRESEKFWTVIVAAATSEADIPTLPSETASFFGEANSIRRVLDASEKCCQLALARTYAMRLLAIDINYAWRNAKSPSKSRHVLTSILADQKKLQGACLSTIAYSGRMDLHLDAQLHLQGATAQMRLSSARYATATSYPALDYLRAPGKSYIYDVSLLVARAQAVSSLSLPPYLLQSLNVDLALIDTQIMCAKAWQALLTTASVALQLTEPPVAKLGQSIVACGSALINHCQQEESTGEIAAAIFVSRLELLGALVELSSFAPDRTLLGIPSSLLNLSAQLFTLDSFQPIDALRQQVQTPFHRPLLATVHALLSHMKSAPPSDNSPLVATTRHALETIFLFTLQGVKSLVVELQPTADLRRAREDLGLLVAVAQQVLASPFCPTPRVWLPICADLKLYHSLFSVLTTDATAFAPADDGSLASHVLTFCLAMAASPQASEALALDGFLTMLYNTPLSDDIAAGLITPLQEAGKSSTSGSHHIWRLILSIVARMASNLSASDTFIAEACALLRYYNLQIERSLRWSVDQDLYLASLEELETTVNLIVIIITKAPHSETSKLLAKQALLLMNTVIYCIQHPNTVTDCIEPLSQPEADWLSGRAAEAGGDLNASDLGVRPITGALLQVFAG